MNSIRPRRALTGTALAAGIAAGSWAAAAPATAPTTEPVLHVTVDTSKYPQMAAEAETLKATVVAEFPRLCRELASPGFTPDDRLTMVFANIGPPAYTTGGPDGPVMTLDVKWMTKHPDDLGIVVHEETHAVQAYRRGHTPGWVTEGIADYTRWFVFEPVAKRPHPTQPKANYNDSYRTTAAFLNWCQTTYDKDLVLKLNAVCRAGQYTEAFWQQTTGHPLADLGAQWKATLPMGRPATRPA